MFQIGDLVLYANMGVCEVTDIVPQSLPGSAEDQLYYTLRPLYQDCVVHTPVNSDKVFMRPVITKEKALQLIDMIPSIQVEPYHNKVNSQLVEHYSSLLHTHDCADLIELTMSIYAKKIEVEGQNRKFGAMDERFMKQAECLLFGELAVALDISRDEVPGFISSRVEGWMGESSAASQ